MMDGVLLGEVHQCVLQEHLLGVNFLHGMHRGPVRRSLLLLAWM